MLLRQIRYHPTPSAPRNNNRNQFKKALEGSKGDERGKHWYDTIEQRRMTSRVMIPRRWSQPTFLLRHLSQALETLLRRGALGLGPSSIDEGYLWRE
jgi:hypothetical protein